MSCSSKVATDKQEVRITDYITNKQTKKKRFLKSMTFSAFHFGLRADWTVQ